MESNAEKSIVVSAIVLFNCGNLMGLMDSNKLQEFMI